MSAVDKTHVAELRADGRDALSVLLRVVRELTEAGAMRPEHAKHATKCATRVARIVAGNFMGRQL